MPPKKLIFQLALATLIGMPLIAVVVDRYTERVDLAKMLTGTGPMWEQVLTGIFIGCATAFVAQKIIELPFMKSVSSKYVNILGGFQLSWGEICLIAVCAGVGEELLFRGAIQPFLGVVWTAILFVAIHGYLNPKDWRVSLYGIYMTLVICVFGWLTNKMGLVPAIIAHTIIDIYLLFKLQQAASEDVINPLEQDHHE